MLHHLDKSRSYDIANRLLTFFFCLFFFPPLPKSVHETVTGMEGEGDKHKIRIWVFLVTMFLDRFGSLVECLRYLLPIIAQLKMKKTGREAHFH